MRQLEIDGETLYRMAENDFRETFGVQGLAIYKSLQSSAYGYVSVELETIYDQLRICKVCSHFADSVDPTVMSPVSAVVSKLSCVMPHG